MAIKQFSTGEVLTAADTNLYLANGGLVTIAGGTFAGASVVDITGFSSSYSLYRLVWRSRRTDASGNGTFTGQFMSGTGVVNSGYYLGGGYANYLGVAGSLWNVNNGAYANFFVSDSFAAESVTVYELSRLNGYGMTWTGHFWYTGAAYHAHSGGACSTASAIDKLRVTASSGTHTGQWILQGERTYT